MRKLLFLSFCCIVVCVCGCGTKQVSRDEIPQIKESIKAFENVIKHRSPTYLDSLRSRDAAPIMTNADSLFTFIYGDSLIEFVGFQHKLIVFRGDAARVDCTISGKGASDRPVTITLRKEGKVWLVKNIEPGKERAIPLAVDSTDTTTK